MGQTPNPDQARLLFDAPPANRDLFAPHFLETRLPQLPEWQTDARLNETLRAIQELYRQRASLFTHATNESQTEQDFIQPVLSLLWQDEQARDCYQVQAGLRSSERTRWPDYAFFRSVADRDTAQGRLSTPEYWHDVACLGDAKRWASSLAREPRSHESPENQVTGYLLRSGVRWGILTNGRVWRLYEREKSRQGGVSHQVDLEEIIRHGSPDAFKRFYLFFRREAFLPDHSGVAYLDRVLQGSEDYATGVSDRLKDAVYDALRLLVNGFLEDPANCLGAAEPGTLRLVHENSLIVLYRLLFLLFAEDRGLLPRNDEPYVRYGLLRIQREINMDLRANGARYPRNGRRYWAALINLFEFVDHGMPEGHVPQYNGGLFRPDRYPHIAHTPQAEVRRWEIGDHRLAHVIDMLAYQRTVWNRAGSKDVDYDTLDVQHLGSIYEGLLELQGRVAGERLVEVLHDGKVVFRPASEVPSPRPVRGQPPRVIEAGEAYLVTNRGERKATGSYYTPKYIVDYILEQTVVPLCEEAARETEVLAPGVAKTIESLEESRSQWALREAQGDPTAEAQIGNCLSAIESEKRRLLEPYLRLRILDPAMGSGHFLVGAADHISLAMATDPSLMPLDAMGDEEPQTFYKRLVAERCLYGVDLNRLAVELAKLSLWLHTVSKDKALSFLDHRLRWGNSLVGARIQEDLTREPPRMDARGRRTNADGAQFVLGFTQALEGPHLQSFLDTLRRIVEAPSGDAAGEQAKEAWFREMDAVRDRFRAVANCWVAPYFGVPVTAEQYEGAVKALRGTPDDWSSLAAQPWFAAAQSEHEGRRFFHWGLEFPEAFFDAHGLNDKGVAGFDAVIGNPPYVRPHHIAPDNKPFLWSRYPPFRAKSDLYVCFMHASTELARPDGTTGMIVSKGWLYLDSFEEIRERLLDTSRIRWLVELGGGVFEQAQVETMVLVLQRALEASARDANIVRVARSLDGRLPGALGEMPQRVFHTTHRHVFDLSLAEPGSAGIKARIDGVSQRLGEIAEIDFGLKTGDDAMFLRTSRQASEDRPLLRGEDVSRYGFEWPGTYVWYVPDQMRAHRPTARPGTPARFECPKLLVKDTSSGLGAAYDAEGYYAKDVLVLHDSRLVSLLYILALVNSKLLGYYYLTSFPTVHVQQSELAQFPIRRIASAPPENDTSGQVELGTCMYERHATDGEGSEVLRFVQEQLDAIPPRTDVVHDLLAFLAEGMVAMHRGKHQEVGGFQRWLEHTIGAQVDSLSGKTRLKEYHQQPEGVAALLAVLRANRDQIAINPDARREHDLIAEEFAASMAKLAPLQKRIADTDWLIDQIVYRLYGLSDEEIAVVEGAWA